MEIDATMEPFYLGVFGFCFRNFSVIGNIVRTQFRHILLKCLPEILKRTE